MVDLSIAMLVHQRVSWTNLSAVDRLWKCEKASNGFKDCSPILQTWDPSDHPAWISSAATVKLPCSQRRTKHLAATVMPSKSGTCDFPRPWPGDHLGHFLNSSEHDYQMITIYYTRFFGTNMMWLTCDWHVRNVENIRLNRHKCQTWRGSGVGLT